MSAYKQIADKLSNLLIAGEKDQKQIALLFDELSDHPNLQAREVQPVATERDQPGDGPIRVGIWEEQTRNGMKVFTRSLNTQMEWSLWANMHEIPPKSHKKRVVLIGESVARGYFYDPYYSVAQELESVLEVSGEFNGVEVVDLAKTSIFLYELGNVVQSCVHLEPDAIVLFAGNNWVAKLAEVLTDEDYEQMKGIFNQDSYAGVKKYLEGKLEEIVGGFFNIIKKTSREHNLPVVVVIPGFNLKDWESDEIERIVAWFSDDQVNQWKAQKEQAEKALVQQGFNILGQSSRKLIDLDPSNPLGYELYAKFLMSQNRIGEAIDYLDQAKDTTIVSRGNNSKPRCFKVIRDSLKKLAIREGMEVVDLFTLFSQEFPDSVPGKELYLDYCHLTHEGIQISMRHTAKAIIEVLNHKTLNVKVLPEAPDYLSNSVKAIAHFCAAIHNAHYGQKEAVLYYHCQRALALHPEIKYTILKYMDFSTRNISTILCRSFEEVILGGDLRQYEGGMALLPPKGKKLMDVALIDAMVKALKSIGEDYEEHILNLRIKEHGLNGGKLDLFQSYYRLTDYNDFIKNGASSYLKIREIDKIVQFVVPEPKDTTLSITLRNPNLKSESASLKVFVNEGEEPFALVKVGKHWTHEQLTISDDKLRKGVNTITLEWPCSQSVDKAHFNDASDSFLETLFPVVGEIHSLEVQAN